ncbi:hypothetical protein CTAYLR_007568 [Chrysophaeum taylorii]|uniref:Neutral ceramidase n=1 Tax=Chrysophaeum taylorii TaxID=2483200 RepID=A0AAD7XKZ9_9STRA|nr:hypothetical protein CTAYLR_007568 [Chrysophaeum taylorii]
MQQHYWLWVASVVGTGSALYVGVGKADATGPPSDYIFMGMAKSSQIGTGLQMRMYARAFVFVDDSGGRAAYVSLDSGMVGYVLKKRALEALNMSEVYNETNVAISGTHSHSGPSGFLQHEIFQLAGSGWVPQTIDAMAGGIAAALALAHEDVEAQIAAGAGLRVMATQTTLENASISRSPSAYLNNPEEERAAYDGDTDNDFTFLGISNNETLRGIATWFAVHGTSMNNTNTFVSSDNKGYASVLMERKWPGSVAAFGSANLGDVSPNILGAFCQNTGEPCDFATSTCPVDAPIRGEIQRNEPCSSVGPGKDMFASTAIIGERQAALAAKLAEQQFLELEDASWVDLSAARVEYRHSFVKMPRLEVYAWDTGAYKGTLCDAALGDAFAAGTVDGPGAFDFAQNSTSSNPLWPIVTNFLHETTPEAVECQHPKTILLPTGNISVPNPWSPSILPMQLLKIGSLVIAAVPTEMTTMAGRRLKAMLAAKFANVTVVIAGLSNEYADYTTTYEEYQAQRYEGGSTIYGPYQLDAYLQEYAKLADAILSGEETPAGPTPEDFSADLDERFWKRLEMLSIESPPSGYDFGDVLFESWNDASALVPGDVVAATFVGADLNNDLKTGATYLEVHYLNVSGWTVLYVDADPETRIDAAKKGDYREVRVRFDIPATAPAGTYRLVYYGDARTRRIGTHVKREAFNATSSTFQVATGS